MVKYYLYVKTHNVTGLKYLGQTTCDPYSYMGSGIRWTRHLKKHGFDITTEIIGEYYNKEDLKRQGIYYSTLWNVKESTEWANLTEENGMGGDLRSGKIHTNQSKKKISESKKGTKHSDETKAKISSSLKGKEPWNKNRGLSEEHKQKISNTAKQSTNTGRFISGYTHSEEDKQKMSSTRKGRIPWNKGITGYKHVK